MGRLTAGMLIALSALFIVAPPASSGAAEIPPTAACSATMKKAMKEYFEATAGSVSDEKERRADRRLVQKLVDADCVSDGEPLLKNLPPKRYSDQCAQAAEITEARWAKPTILLKTWENKLEARQRKIERRQKQIRRKAKRLKRRGASQKRLAPLYRADLRLMIRSVRMSIRLAMRSMELVRPRAFETTLTFFELVSLRCAKQNVLDNLDDPKGPVEKLLKRNEGFLHLSLASAILETDPETMPVVVSASAIGDGSRAIGVPERVDLAKLPLVD